MTKSSVITRKVLLLAIILLGDFVLFAPAHAAITTKKTTKSAATSSIHEAGPLILKIKTVANPLLTRFGVLWETNRARAETGNLPALNQSATLNAVAQARLTDMFAKQYFAHVSPSSVTPTDVADKIGYAYLNFGENIALGNFADDITLVEAWMHSPHHRENILNTTYQEIGIAVGAGMYHGKKTWIAVQNFGRPRSACNDPDNSLKIKIDNLQSGLDTLQANAAELRASLFSGRARQIINDMVNYNQMVIDYNAIVIKANLIIDELRPLAASYNSQVTMTNACVQGK